MFSKKGFDTNDQIPQYDVNSFASDVKGVISHFSVGMAVITAFISMIITCIPFIIMVLACYATWRSNKNKKHIDEIKAALEQNYYNK